MEQQVGQSSAQADADVTFTRESDGLAAEPKVDDDGHQFSRMEAEDQQGDRRAVELDNSGAIKTAPNKADPVFEQNFSHDLVNEGDLEIGPIDLRTAKDILFRGNSKDNNSWEAKLEYLDGDGNVFDASLTETIASSSTDPSVREDPRPIETKLVVTDTSGGSQNNIVGVFKVI